MKIKVAIAEDHQLFRLGMISLLEELGHIEVLYAMENGKRFLESYQQHPRQPDVCLIDLEMPVMNGNALCTELLQLNTSSKLIILSQHYDDNTIGMMFEKGIHGYLSKNAAIEEVSTAISSVYESGFYMDVKTLSVIRMAVTRRHSSDMVQLLTKRELEILQLICLEYTNGEIAEKLFLSGRTVEGHRNNMLCKTGSRNTAGLVVFALKNKIVSLNDL